MKAAGGERHPAADARQLLDLHGVSPVEEGARRQEKRRLEQRMIDDVDEAAGQSSLAGKANAQGDVAQPAPPTNMPASA